MDNSRVLKQLNRSDARAERDVAALKNRDVKPAVCSTSQTILNKRGGTAAAPKPSGPSERPGAGSRDQASSDDPAAVVVAETSVKASQEQQRQQDLAMQAQQQADAQDAAATGLGSQYAAPSGLTAAPGGSPSLLAAAAARLAAGGAKRAQQVLPLQDSCPADGAADGQDDDEDSIEDSDSEQAPTKKLAAADPNKRCGQAAGTAATGSRPSRTAQQQQQQQSSRDDADGAGIASEGPSEEASSDEDSPQEKQQPARQQRTASRPARQVKQPPKQQEQPATGRARRAAAVAAVDRMRGAEVAVQQQEQAIRRSTRTKRAAAAASPEDSGDDVPVVRPRRAAAAAAKEATAAALAAEAAPTTWASQPDSDSSDLGTPDASDAEEAQGSSGSDDDMAGSDSEGSGAGSDDELDGSGSWGTGSKRQQTRTRPSRQQPKRGKGGRAVVVDESDEPDSQAEDEGSPDAAAVSGDEEEGGDLPLNLDAFRFNGKAPAAAAGSKRGTAKRRGSSGSGCGSRESSEEPDAAATAAALQEEEELSRHVLDASEFAPEELTKLPRGDDIDKCLAVRYEEDDSITVLAKLTGKSYRNAVWLPSVVVERKRPSLLRMFLSRHAGGQTDTDWADNNNINPVWYKIDRNVSEYKHARQPTQYLVKWCALEYSESTWEVEEEICRDGAGQVALSRYKRWSAPPQTKPTQSKRPRQELLDQQLLPGFKNGRKLRDYQEQSLHWMVNNYRGQIVSGKWQPRNCILGDEMGLGKTAQSIAVISWLKQYAGATAPCMVVAPLTTLGHWKREIETWTDLNVVLYAGSAEDRRIIREHEWFYPRHKTCGPRFDVLLSSYETVLKDKSEFKRLHFEALIVDEAHRLKNQKSATRLALQDLSVRWLLMLSGTPVQNNMKELQGLMSLLDDDLYGDVDQFLETYGSDTPTLEQIRALQAALAPVLLRRMKEDVEDLPEKEEVVIWVELTAEQRRYYKALYSQQIGALLGGGSSKNLPNMRNLAMELRKLCCHPFLCDGLEDDMTLKWQAAQAAAEARTHTQQEIDNYTRASGKMLLLHKLLPKLRAEGRQVLIFSQFKMMLDVIEDYLTACDHPFERIDGDTKQSARQAAIDRFMAVKDRQRSKTPTSRAASPSPAAESSGEQGSGGAAAAAGGTSGQQQSAANSRGPSPSAAASGEDDTDGPFVFLLSTRAGGQGITLTSADTVIIYDSDWNPQNDLQAMARCHRIGQEKEVTVYRLVSKNTYEQQLFECSSRKMGLDEAILGFAGSGDNPENDAARIEQLLRLGAHAIMQGGEAGAGGDAAGEDKGFAAEDIEQILLGRSEKRQLGCRKGNTFSIAHFGDGGGELEPEQEQEQEEAEVAVKDSKAFWSELLPEAAAEHAARANRGPEVLGPRRRKQVDYREANMGARSASSSDFSGGEEDEEDGGASGSKGTKRAAEDEVQQAATSKKAKKKGDEPVVDPELGRVIEPWRTGQVDLVREALLRYGPDRMDKVVQQCHEIEPLKSRQADEIAQLVKAMLLTLEEMGRLAPALQQEEKAARDAATAAAAAAAAAGDPAGAAAAQAQLKSHGNMSVQYVKGLRDALIKAGLGDKLPHACSKAMLAPNSVRSMGRAPASLIQQLEDHRKVHKAMLAAGLAVDSPTSSKPAASGSSQQQQGQPDGPASTPAKSQPAAAAAAGSEAAKRVWVAPRVLLRGSKGMPGWWKREHDDLLLQGCYAYGYPGPGSKLNGVVEAILQDPVYSFHTRFSLDPEALLREAANQAALKQPPIRVEVQVTGPDGVVRTDTREQLAKPVIDPVALAAAQRRKLQLQLQEAHPDIELLGTSERHRLVLALVQRLKRVRAALLDPDYVEPATPSKQLHVVSTAAAQARPAPAAAAAAAAAAGGAIVQQRLQFAPGTDGSFTYKGKKVIGGGLGAPGGATAATAGGPARTPPGPGAQFSLSSEAGRQLLQTQQRAVAQQNAAQLANVARTMAALAGANAAMQAQLQAKKRQAEEQLESAAKRANSSSLSPVGVQRQQQPMFTPQQAAVAAEIGRRMQAQQAMVQQRQQAQAQRQQQKPEVVELLDDSSDDEQPAAPGAAASRQQPVGTTPAVAVGPAAAAPPSSGLLVRRVPAGADLSQEQSVDEPAGAGAVDAAAPGTVSSSGKQHMQQILGDAQPGSSPRKGASSKAAAADHPVYGTPAAAAAAAAAGAKRKQSKDDPKQSKINAFFATSK